MDAVSVQSQKFQVCEMFEIARMQNVDVVPFYRQLIETGILTQHVFADCRQLIVRLGMVCGVV